MKIFNKTTLAISLLLVMIIVAGCTTQTVQEPQDTVAVDNSNSAEMKTFVLTGGNYWFEMDGQRAPELRVKLGDKVRIEFTNVEGFHDFVVDEFNAATEQINTGGSTFVEFVADKTGTFEYYCSVGQHRANGMVGNLVVE